VHLVDPVVDSRELDVKVEITEPRRLHAKAVVCASGDYALAYAGSANFTHRGWGFGTGNIEAGWMVSGKTKQLLRLVPPTTGSPIPLPSSELVGPKETEPEEEGQPWPSFLHEVMLEPAESDEDQLELVARWGDDAPDTFRLATVAAEGIRSEDLLQGGGPAGEGRVTLSRGNLTQLLVDREVWVHMPSSDEPVAFPVNVAQGEARLRLPVAPNAVRPGEAALIAYYQGRISFDDMYPSTEAELQRHALGPSSVEETGVDTSKIQSYQVRAFVEALPGLRRDLESVRGTRAVIAHAFLGEVSPVALARAISEQHFSGGKSATAAAFELVEIARAVRDAAEHTEGREPEVLQEVGDRALKRINGYLNQVKKKNPAIFKDSQGFEAYEKTMLGRGAR
jgi:hypothetical protein